MIIILWNNFEIFFKKFLKKLIFKNDFFGGPKSILSFFLKINFQKLELIFFKNF